MRPFLETTESKDTELRNQFLKEKHLHLISLNDDMMPLNKLLEKVNRS